MIVCIHMRYFQINRRRTWSISEDRSSGKKPEGKIPDGEKLQTRFSATADQPWYFCNLVKDITWRDSSLRSWWTKPPESTRGWPMRPCEIFNQGKTVKVGRQNICHFTVSGQGKQTGNSHVCSSLVRLSPSILRRRWSDEIIVAFQANERHRTHWSSINIVIRLLVGFPFIPLWLIDHRRQWEKEIGNSYLLMLLLLDDRQASLRPYQMLFLLSSPPNDETERIGWPRRTSSRSVRWVSLSSSVLPFRW